MSLACETEIRVQNELSLRFAIVSKPTPTLEYIKTISSLVGASHILAVFEEDDYLKVFFDDKQFVDILIRSRIHVMGHHVKVDYVIPPGTKVVLSNIDPVVPNFDLTRLLTMYGTVVSPIICPPISYDIEFCHIGYGVRYCYMSINDPLPNKLEFKYGDQVCVIKIKVYEEMALVPFIKSDESDLNETDIAITDFAAESFFDPNLESTRPIVVSVESTASESNSDLHLDNAKLSNKRSYVKRKGQSHKAFQVKRTRVTATARAAKKIKHNVKRKWIGAKRIKPFRRGKTGGRKPIKLLKKSVLQPPSLLSLSHKSSSDVNNSMSPPLLITENKRNSVSPLSEKELMLFIDECKHNRAPIELAKRYLRSDCNEDEIHHLIDQIERHSKNSSCQSLKLRLNRLCKSLAESVNASKS